MAEKYKKNKMPGFDPIMQELVKTGKSFGLIK